MNRVCMRVDAYHEIGYGHLKRCLVIAESLRDKGIKVFFLLGGDSIAGKKIGNAGFDYQQISSKMNFSEQAVTIDYIYKNISCIVLDLAHSIAIKNTNGLSIYLEALHSRSFIVLIDSFGIQSLREHISALTCDLLVSPYVGEKKATQHTNYIELLGTDYFVLDSVYSNCGKKNIREFADRVLITCGGSDPHSISAKILNALSSDVKRALNVKVIVGSAFSTELYETLLSLSKNSPHNVMLINSPEELSAEMLWCDITVATSGLTKYELAATGTPAILMSVDLSHDTVNQYFSQEKSVIDLRIAGEVSDFKLAKNIWTLLEDADERRRQSLTGQSFIDGNGTLNLTNEILKNINDVHN